MERDREEPAFDEQDSAHEGADSSAAAGEAEARDELESAKEADAELGGEA